jgi:diguanylate cyclase (GGDEF)-like protein
MPDPVADTDSTPTAGPRPAVAPSSATATASVDLRSTLDLLAQTIVQALGFGVAVVNLAQADGSQAVVSVAGSADAREALHGHVDSADVWARLLAVSEPWGRLCFLDHRNQSLDATGVLSWIPDIEISSDPQAWHPEDALFAPLYASDGSMLGVLSVDLPRDGLRPDQSTRNALEAFAVSAALAIEHATLRSRAEESEQRFQKLASADPLTGLGNRSLLLDRLQHACQRRSSRAMALVFVDLDGFKQVNDAYSHAHGDFVLLTVAQRLRAVVRQHDTVARWGGDEFIVLLEEVPAIATVSHVTGRINEVVAWPIVFGGDTMQVTASIGVTINEPRSAAEPDSLIRDADSAMYSAKRGGKNRTTVFDRTLRDHHSERDHIEALLARAVAEDRLVLHYQPVVRLSDAAVVGVEALLRLRDDDDTLLYPGEFLHIALETDHLSEIENEVLRRACEQAVAWAARGHELKVSVNVCAAQLAVVDDFERAVLDALDSSGLPPDRLICEVTEHTAFEITRGTVAGMARLMARGVDFSIDDFGTGYASLAYLRSLAVQEIKVDASFVQAAPSERASAAIVRAVATLATELGVRCVAEGVESQEQHTHVRALGIELAQGFVYGRPSAAEHITGVLETAAAR